MNSRVAILMLAGAVALASDSMQRGQEAFRRKDWAASERLFGDAVRERPNNAAAHQWLGMTFAAQEKYALAEIPFRRACSLEPTSDSCYYLGRALTLVSRFDDAVGVYTRIPPPGGKQARVLLGMAVALEGLDRLIDAEAYYRQAIAAGSEQATVDFKKFQQKKAVMTLPAPDVRFEAHDLPVTVRNGATGKKHLPETMIGGVAVFDADGDGWPDIFVANGAEMPSLRKTAAFSNALLRNNRDGTFTDVTSRAGLHGRGFSMGTAAADYDNDGDTDLFVAGVNQAFLYRNRGDGTFEDVTASSGIGERGVWSVAAAWLDYDGDGRLDLFVARYVQWNPTREIYCGTPAHRQYCHPRFYAPLPNALYRNRGDGTFEDVSRSTGIAAHAGKGMGVAIGDYDGDGWLDIFAGNDTVPNFLFRYTKGKFEETAVAAGVAYNESGVALSSMGAEMRDLDNDGREDLFVTALTNETFPLFRNTPRGFVDVTLATGIAKASLPWTGWSAAAIDVDNDGWKDLVTANGHVMDNAEATGGRKSRQPPQVYLNRRGKFAVAALSGDALHRGLAFGDFDRDGRLDFVITRLNEPAQIWWNRNTAGNWVAFQLRGTRSNRDGIGAMVRVETEAGSQWNRMVTSNGYGGSSAGPIHFGIGSVKQVKAVEIRWPSGATQTLQNVDGNRVIAIVEQYTPSLP